MLTIKVFAQRDNPHPKVDTRPGGYYDAILNLSDREAKTIGGLLSNHPAGVEQTLVLYFDSETYTLDPPNPSSGGVIAGIDDSLD